MVDMFLTKEELETLTTRRLKSLQIEQLRKRDILFFVNAIGHPVVARIAIESRPAEVPALKKKMATQ